MAYTATWNAAFEALPAATDNVSDGDDKIRDFKLAIRERISKDHYFDIAGTDADHGEHSKVTLRVGSAPSAVANKGFLYAKDVSSKAELFYIDEAGNEVQLSASTSSWVQTTGTFTATPASTSTITMTTDLTALISVGMSLKYVIGGVTKYGRVAAIASNLLTVNGAPLSGDVTALYYGGGTVRQITVIIPNTYEDASNTALITSDLNSSLLWSLPTSYCVYFGVYSKTHDSTTHGQASVRINNTEVCTTAGGLTIAADATWYYTVVDIAIAAYDINPGELIEVTSVKAGAGDASDLTVMMIFVTP